jgi:hypothetical protein
LPLNLAQAGDEDAVKRCDSHRLLLGSAIYSLAHALPRDN